MHVKSLAFCVWEWRRYSIQYNGYPAGYLRFFWIRIFIFEKNWIRTGSGYQRWSLLDIRQHSEFATGYGYPKTAFKRQPETEPDIRNAFIDISRIQTFGKNCTLLNHSFIIFRSIFSTFCAMTPILSNRGSRNHFFRLWLRSCSKSFESGSSYSSSLRIRLLLDSGNNNWSNRTLPMLSLKK